MSEGSELILGSHLQLLEFNKQDLKAKLKGVPLSSHPLQEGQAIPTGLQFCLIPPPQKLKEKANRSGDLWVRGERRLVWGGPRGKL